MMAKKVLAILLSVALLIGVMPVGAISADVASNSASAAVSDMPTFVAEDAMAKVGESFTVPIRVQNNPGIVSFKLSIGYDSDVLELVSGKLKDFTSGESGTSPLTSNPFIINWADTLNPNNTTDGTAALLTFKVKEGAAIGDTAITVNYDPDDVYDANYDNVTFAAVQGTVSVVEYVDMAVTTKPDKVQYVEWKDEFDPAGGKVTLYYNNGVSEVVDLTADMVSGFDNTRLGEQTVTVTCEGFTDEIEVEIVSRSLVSIKVTAKPHITYYTQYQDELDLTGGKITAYYNNNTQEVVTITPDMVNGFDNTKAGRQFLTVTYQDAKTSFPITILNENSPHFFVEDAIAAQGDTFTVPVCVQNNTGIVSFKLSVGYDSDVLELVASEWKDFTGGVTGTSLVTDNPFIINWTDTLNGNNMTDGTVALLTFQVKENAAVGNTAISLRYNPEDVYDELYANVAFATFNGTVRVTPPCTGIAVTTKPYTTEYLEETDAFDPNGGKVTVYYADGTSEVLDLTADMVSGFDNTTIGSQMVTVTYRGCTDTFEVVILARTEGDYRYSVEDGKATITEYLGAGGSVQIPAVLRGYPVTAIGDHAFDNCMDLLFVQIPDSVTHIGEYAFYNCSGLGTLNFNSNLQYIGSYAFAGCSGLISLVLNETLVSIADYAFADCENLTAVRIPKSVTYFGTDSFYNCPQLTIYCYNGSAAHIALTGTEYSYFLLDGHVHTYQVTELDAASCTGTGSQLQVCTDCRYNYIEMTPALGHQYTSAVVAPTCTAQGYTRHTCSVCGHWYKDAYVPANGHTYGEWTVYIEPTVLAEGVQRKACVNCDHFLTRAVGRLSIDIEENDDYGLAVFTVVHAQTLAPIPGAQIFISTENDGENTFTTDANGQANVVLPIGKQAVSVYASGCLTRNLKVDIQAGVNEIEPVGLSDMPTYDAEITSERMTIEEIEEAGIDTSDPSNQHVFKYELKLGFEAEIDYSSIIAYFNADGAFLGGYSPGNAPPVDVPSVDVEPTYNLHYHVTTDGFWHSWCKNVKVNEGDTVELSYRPWRDNDDFVFDGWYADATFTKKIDSVNIQKHTTYVYGRWIYVGEGKEPVTSTGGIRVPIKDEIVTVYPVNEYFYLIVRGEVSWLKEMFDVEMLVINNSKTDTLEDLTATLELPEGLSLAKMIDEQQSLSQTIGHIGEGESKSVHWYVRGDTAGSYSLKARLQGMVMPFEEPIDDVFIAENQLQVWAGNALHLHFEVPDAAYYADDYPITISLKNVSDITLYNVNHMLQIEQGMVIYYSDGTKKEKIEKSVWESIGVREFHPGDELIIEASVNIFFESEIIERRLQRYIDMVDGIEQLINSFKAIKAVYDAANLLYSCVDGCTKAMGEFIESAANINAKMKLFAELHDNISNLVLPYASTGNDTLDAAVKLTNSGLNTTLQLIAADPKAWYDSVDIETIQKLSLDVAALVKAASSSDAASIAKFNIFDSIRTAISAIPVVFTLKDLVLIEDANNTTSIPWSYSIIDVGPRYFGVSSVSKYIMSIVQAGGAEIYDELAPGFFQLIPGLDDPFNKAEAVRYIQATEKEIAKFKARAATGNVTFRAWVERSGNRGSAASDFELSCDNETATYEDGVLQFNGDGTISVLPQGQTNGILHIEDSEGNHYTYVMDVVEQHTCATGEQQVVVAPTAENDGFAVKCCELCGEVLEIIPLEHKNCCETHAFGTWMTEVAPTFTEAGVQVRTCATCGTTEYRFLDVVTTTDPIFVVGNATAKTGNTFTVPVRVQNNPGITSLKFLIGYDSDVLELISCKAQDFTNGLFGTSPLNSNPFIINWADTLSGNNTTDGTVALLTFKVKEGVEVNSTEITLQYNPDDVYDVNYDNVTFATADATVKVLGECVRIALAETPYQSTYLEGKDTFDAFGGKLLLYYSNGAREIINLTDDMVSGFDNTKVGTQTLTVTYEEFTTTFQVEILPKSLTSIAVTTEPGVKEYFEETGVFSAQDGKVTLYYNNDTSEVIELTADMVSGFDNTKPGVQTLTVTVDGFTTTFQVEVIAKAIASIAVTTKPRKVHYLAGVETLVVTDGKLSLYYNNGMTDVVDLTADMVSGFDNTIVGEHQLTVTYEDLTTTLPIRILGENAARFEVGAVSGKAGDTITVPIYVKNNTGIVSLKLGVEYDRDVLELISVTQKDFTGDAFSTGSLTDDTIFINWTNTLGGNHTTDGTIALLTFKIREDAELGSTPILLFYDPEDVYDQDYQNVAFASPDGIVNVVDYISGDVNDDTKINNKDLGLLLQYLNNWDVEVMEPACDVNRDSKINNKDLGILLQYLNNWDVELK